MGTSQGELVNPRSALRHPLRVKRQPAASPSTTQGSDSKTLTLIEITLRGHRSPYVAAAALHAAEHGIRVRLVVPDDDPPGQTGLRRLLPSAPIQDGVISIIPVNCRRPRRTILRETLQRHPTDAICILDGDSWASTLMKHALTGPRRRRPVTVLVMRPYRHPGLMGAARHVTKALLFAGTRLLAHRTVIGALVVDNTAPAGYRRACRVGDLPLALPSTGGSKASARARFDIAGDDLVLAVLGAFSPRKCPSVVFGAAEVLALESHRKVVVFAPGQTDPHVARHLEGQAPRSFRAVLGDAYLSPADYALALQVPDVVLALHDNEGSSGAVLEAVAAGIPVVAAGAASLCRQVDRLHAGVVCPLDPRQVARAVLDVLTSEQGRRPPRAVSALPRAAISVPDFAISCFAP
jgi:glycosyltransferase involved in cell wall biosynthesis